MAAATNLAVPLCCLLLLGLSGVPGIFSWLHQPWLEVQLPPCGSSTPSFAHLLVGSANPLAPVCDLGGNTTVSFGLFAPVCWANAANRSCIYFNGSATALACAGPFLATFTFAGVFFILGNAWLALTVAQYAWLLASSRWRSRAADPEKVADALRKFDAHFSLAAMGLVFKALAFGLMAYPASLTMKTICGLPIGSPSWFGPFLWVELCTFAFAVGCVAAYARLYRQHAVELRAKWMVNPDMDSDDDLAV